MASATSWLKVNPTLPIASTMRSSAARLCSRWGETSLVADVGGQPALLDHGLQRVVYFGTLAQQRGVVPVRGGEHPAGRDAVPFNQA